MQGKRAEIEPTPSSGGAASQSLGLDAPSFVTSIDAVGALCLLAWDSLTSFAGRQAEPRALHSRDTAATSSTPP
jgi:hypothetical protein